MKLPLKWITLIALSMQTLAAQSIELPGESCRLYTDVSGGYIQSKDFDGGGGSARIGYNIQHGHNVEFEANFFFESASANPSTHRFVTASQGAIVALPSTYSQKRKVDLNMFPLMFNYRYIGHFGSTAEPSKLLWYAGLGAGVVIFDWEDKYSWSSSGVIGNNSGSATYSETKAAFGAQGFLGAGYAFTQKLSATFGGRILGTQKYSFGGNTLENPSNPANSFNTSELKTDTVHWMVEAGLHYKW